MPQVRLISESDSMVELTHLLHRAYARLGELGLNYTAVDQSAQVTAKRIQGGICYVATFAGALVGTIVVQPTYSQNDCDYFTRPGVAAVHQFAVEPDQQRLGIGRLLLATAESWARENGFHELAMDTAEQATHLIAFYSRLGYEHVGWVQWPGKVYRSVVLSKRLQADA